MANLKKSVAENAPGAFFVDRTCIDCDTCRQIAPAVFGEAPGHAFVRRQPTTPNDRRQALHALVSCPTGSIGSVGDDRPQSVMDDFPLAVEGPVYTCGFNSPKSYGGNSYFVRRPDGNWLIDSPKFLPRLVRRFEEWGGVAHIFLTHSDDVADAGRYAERFGEPALHPPGRAARAARRRDSPRRGGADSAGRRVSGDSDARPHGGPLCPALCRTLPVHRRSSGLGPRRAAAGGVSRLLLVFVASTNGVDAAAGGVFVRVGPARPRPTGPFAAGGDAPTSGGTRGAYAEPVSPFLRTSCRDFTLPAYVVRRPRESTLPRASPGRQG